MRQLHVWCPNIFGFKGGIQVFSKHFIESLQIIEPQSVLDVSLLHDKVGDFFEQEVLKSVSFHFSGRWPTRIRNIVFSLMVGLNAIRQQPDLIITTHLNFVPIAYWLKIGWGIPYWTIAHGIEAWNIKKPVIRQALKNADLILAVSNHTRDRLIQEQKLNPCQIVVLPNTVNPEQFKPAPKPDYLLNRYDFLANQPIIFTVCRLCKDEAYKGYDSILEALPIIKEEFPDVHYLLGGTGDDQERILDQVAELGLKGSVTLTGFIPDEELADHYNLCDLFALPSKLEGFGIVYLEALVCSKPTLGGNQDGAVDALCGGKLGALVDPDDIEAIAQSLIQMLQGTYPNPLMYQPEALRQAVIDTYGIAAFQRRLANLLQESKFTDV